MARKLFFKSKAEKAVTPVTPVASVDTSVKSTVSRNSPIPKIEPRREVTHEAIAIRAFEIYLSGCGSDEQGNWLKAERELKSL